MSRFRLALAAVIATWILLVIGGLVNPMGASLACPDWYFVPTCNGELLPEMQGGVLFEHGHRLWASWVGLLTLALWISVQTARSVDRTTKRLALLAVVLVAVQGTLGGMTVLVGLNPVLSILHLGTAMGFFCLLVWIAFRLHPTTGARARIDGRQSAIGLAAAVVALQIVLGGMVRHLGAGLICGNDWLGCGPMEVWMAAPLAWLHMGHRVLGYVLVPVLAFACGAAVRDARERGQAEAIPAALLPMVIVVLQVSLGVFTVLTGRSVAIVVLHTAVAGLLLASLVVCHLLLGTARAASNNARFALESEVRLGA